jgi:hypothetical protein
MSQHGDYLRMSFSSQKTTQGLHLSISPHEGTYPDWWKAIHAEIFSWSPTEGKIIVNAKAVSSPIDQQVQNIGFTIVDDGKGVEVEVK